MVSFLVAVARRGLSANNGNSVKDADDALDSAEIYGTP
jgi:hypothetical protein